MPVRLQNLVQQRLSKEWSFIFNNEDIFDFLGSLGS